VIRANRAHRKNERGVTIVLVAFSLAVLLGMAALAIDVATLYVAHGEAQRAADAAALAGARMFASSGYTSASTVLPAADICQTSATPGADAAANRQAEATAAQNLVAGQPAVVQSITCDNTPANPQIKVTVVRTGLPTFFGRIFGRAANSVTAIAVAEAFNSSGSTTPVRVKSVKPWLIPNCDPDPANPGPSDCGAAGSFVDPADGSIKNNGSFVGEKIMLVQLPGPTAPVANPPGRLQYYRLDVPITPAPVCPSTSSVSCGQVGSDPYHDNIACTSTVPFSCGQIIGPGSPAPQVTVQTPSPTVDLRTTNGTQCLIHAGGENLLQGQDAISVGVPAIITGGDNNPNPALQGVTNISRSDSVVTVPIYQGVSVPNLCPGACSNDGRIVGFLQLGIRQKAISGPPPPGANGKIEAVIMNVAGCNPGAVTSGITPVSGGGVSPIPVRLIHQ
jgi:putative Flp pilus-assembly TadE/G-like protein